MTTPTCTMGPAILFCPADRPERFAKAAERADAVILDLEDAVAPDAKPAARENVRAAGTNSSSTERSWLPVPFNPDTSQVSTTLLSRAGKSISRRSGMPFASIFGPSSPRRIAPPSRHSECSHPLAKLQLPVSL